MHLQDSPGFNAARPLLMVFVGVIVAAQVSLGGHTRREVVSCDKTDLEASPSVFLGDCNTTVLGTWKNVSTGVVSTRVQQFRGIPFALPPVGQRRFSATEDLTCPIGAAGGTFDASNFGNPCMQTYGEIVVGQEDCLYLNVYVPEAIVQHSPPITAHDEDGAKDHKKLLAPVLVYIHGGSLVIGSGAFEQLEFLAAFASGNDSAVSFETSAIVVTINYRLALLGFLATPSMCDEAGSGGTCGNYGIMDQQAALRWVQLHIESFGGDPQRVSIMGQSSGGTSVFALLGSKRSAGLFQAGISLSGSPNITMDRATKLQQDAAVAAVIGCPFSAQNNAAQLACLRNLSADFIQLSMPNSWNLPFQFSNRHLDNASLAGEGYIGLVYVDGVVIEAPIWPAIASGSVSGNVTLVFGNMGQESNLEPPQESVSDLTEAEWRSFIGGNIFETWANGTSSVAAKVNELYLNASTVNPQLAYDSLNTDYGMTCASYSIANLFLLQSSSSKRSAPVYMYVHQQGPSRPALLPNGPMAYAFHTWDYTNACHNWFLYDPTEEDRALSSLQRAQWFSLWTTGKLPLSFGWPDIRETTASHKPQYFLFAQPSRYPFRKTGATDDPFAAPGLCEYLINELGMDERYWWCN